MPPTQRKIVIQQNKTEVRQYKTVYLVRSILFLSQNCLIAILSLSYFPLIHFSVTEEKRSNILEHSYYSLRTILLLSCYNLSDGANCLLAKVSGNCLLIVFRSSLFDLISVVQEISYNYLVISWSAFLGNQFVQSNYL